MNNAQTLTTPRDVDTALAAAHNTLRAAVERRNMFRSSILNAAGAHYRGRQRVTDMTFADAEPIVRAALAACDDDDYGYTREGFHGSSSGNARRAFAGIDEQQQIIADAQRTIAELNKQYTGWSRFFLVTSSAGHVHNSMSCPTCRPTTAYGWMPELSGKTESDAVDELGPALCSVCFPTAPVEHVGGKLTKSQAAKLAA